MHPNMLPVLKIVETEKAYYLLHAQEPFSLGGVMRFSKSLLDTRDTKLFIVYQIAQMLHYSHSNGIVHGHLHPLNIHLSADLWVYLSGFQCPSSLASISPSPWGKTTTFCAPAKLH